MEKSEKRILIVTSEFPPLPGGIGTHSQHLAKYLSMEGFKVTVLTDQRTTNLEEDLLFDNGQLYKVCRVLMATPRLGMYFSRLRNLFVLSSKADVILASGKFSLWVVAFASLFFKRQYLAVIHGTEVNFKNLLLKWTVATSLKRFKTVIAVSQYTKSLVDPLRLKKVIVIPNGIDGSAWDDTSKTAMVLQGHPKLITVGNVTDRKGQLNLIKMLPELIKSFPELHYHCVGIPTEVERFLTIANELQVAAHVTFHGRVGQEHLQQFLKASDVFVMLSSTTSTGDVEGFGIAILEANALGIPAIGSKESGIEDAIRDGVSGYLIPHDDPQAFNRALQQILDHKEDFSKQAKVWAAQHDWDKIVKRYVGVIESK